MKNLEPKGETEMNEKFKERVDKRAHELFDLMVNDAAEAGFNKPGDKIPFALSFLFDRVARIELAMEDKEQ